MNRFAKAFVFCVILCELLASAQRDCLGQQSDTNKSAASFPSQWFFQSLRGQASQEREWLMSDGLKLRGRAVVDGIEKLEIHSTSGEEPQVVRLSISELPPESKKLILDALPKVEDRFLRFAYYQGAEVNPVWSGAQPKFPQRFRLAVHDDQTHVYFSSGESLILVEKAAFTEASLKETLEAIAKVRHQLVLSVDNKFLRAVGVPVQLTTRDVVMEVKQPYTYSSLKFNAGLRYLLPLQSLTPLQQEVCKTVVADVQAETKPTQLSDDELSALPRVCFTAMSQRFVMPRSTSSPDTVMAGEQTQQMQPMSANELSCSDYLWWAGNGKGASSSDSAGKPEISPELLTALVDTIATREFWMQKSGIPFRGQLVGSVADGFIFESRGMGQFFVPATQLHNVDATIALTFSRLQPPKAVADKIVNLKSVFARRVISDGALVELRDEMISLKGAYVGELPKIIYAGTQNRSFVPNHFSDLAAINEIQKWLRENATILEASDATAGIQQLASKYPMSLQPADTKLMPSQRVQKWQLAQRGVSFEALVVGEHEGDLVFETTVKDRKEKFLVDPRALDPTSASEAQKFVARLERKDWSSELTRHANWQNYRIWADPSGKLKVPTDPVVVLSISESLVRFATLDGREYSEPMPFDTTRKLATVSLFGKALDRSSKDRAKAESNLTLWSFQDSEPKVRATLVGLADDCILVRDVNQVEFLINKITLSTESQTALESLVKTTSNLRRLDSAEVWKTPRVWCTRTTVVGPAVPEYLTDNDATLVIVQINGEKQLLKLKDLTLREQLSFLAAWHLKQNKLERPSEGPVADSLQTVDKWLSAEIPATEQITAIPKLDAVIEGQIKSAFEQWKHSAWESQNISLPADSQLLAINADATAGVVSVNSSWSLVDFATGRTQVLSHAPQAKPESSPSQVGPWMGTAPDVVYWIDNGQVRYARPDKAEAAEVIRDLQPVLAASQSGDFRFLVVLLADNTVRRIDLSNQQHDVVFTADMLGNVAARAPSLWSSSDGLSILLSRGTSAQLLVKRSDTTPALAAYLGSAKPTATAAVGKSQAWFSTESQSRGLTRIVGSTMLLPPSTYGTAFPTKWFGPADIEGREVFQAIGRFEDLQSQSQDRFYVTYTGPRDYFEEYPTQWIDGQVDQRARVAADGAAIVHWRAAQAVVSRRPKNLPRAPELVLYKIVESLVNKREIGQLEAIGQLFRSAAWNEYGPHTGWLSMHLQRSVDTATLHYQEHLGGDCLERAINLSRHFQRRFPTSQIAANSLASLERGLAWKARGDGFADSVTPAGSEAFQRHMRQAKSLLTPFLNKEPSAATLDSAIDVAMGTGDLVLAKRVADIIAAGEHSKNANLHHSLSFLLLPRWHGKPGAAEAYRDLATKRLDGKAGDILYAQMAIDMFDVHGWGQPLSKAMEVDIDRVVEGVEAYYENHTHPDLMDRALIFTAMEQEWDQCKRLFRVKTDKKLLPSKIVLQSPKNFTTIEREASK